MKAGVDLLIRGWGSKKEEALFRKGLIGLVLAVQKRKLGNWFEDSANYKNSCNFHLMFW
jgi:hypothetical protein